MTFKKNLKFLFSLLIFLHLALLPACSKSNDIKPKYDSQLLVSWMGVSFNCPSAINKPSYCPFPEESAENCPCAYITSFQVTISQFRMRKVYEDFSVGDPFDFFQGKSYQFDLKKAQEGHPFVTPDFVAKLDPSMYEVLDFVLEDIHVEVSGDPDLTQQLNDDLRASLPMTIVPDESREDWTDPFFWRKIPLQEGWSRNLFINFSCSESIKVSVVSCEEILPGILEYQYSYSLDPDIKIFALTG